MTAPIGMSGYLHKEDMLASRVNDLTRQRDFGREAAEMILRIKEGAKP